MPEIKFFGGKQPRVRYVSGTTVYEETLDSTRFVGIYWSASGKVHTDGTIPLLLEQNPTLPPCRRQAFDLVLDGQELHNRWDWVDASERTGKRTGTVEAVIELKHQVRPVTVKVVTVLDGTLFLTRYLEITNTGKAPAALSGVSPWSGLLWGANDADNVKNIELLPVGCRSVFTLGYLDGLLQGGEGNLVWESLPTGVRRIEGNNGRSGFGGPYFILKNEITGECAFGALAWSGNWYAEFWQDPYRNRENMPVTYGGFMNGFRLVFRMGPAGTAPLRLIAAGETVVTPEMHLSVMHAGFDECVQEMHRHLTVSVIPVPPKGKEIYTLAGMVVEKPGDWILREIEIAAKMGCEAYCVDAGWFGTGEFPEDWGDNRGDWVDGKWVTGGLDGCRKLAHKHKMLFGLWMEPEAVGYKSRLLAEHPDWVLETDGGRAVCYSTGGNLRRHRTLDLANPEAAQYLTESVLRVIRDYRPDFFKLDYNIDVFEGGQHRFGRYLENESWRHQEAIYRAFERARREFPEVALENCASGGGRNDLGMMSRFHYASISDFGIFPRSIRIINGLTTFLPPEVLLYYHNQAFPAHLNVDSRTHLRVTLFSRAIFLGFGPQEQDFSAPPYDETRRYIKLAREFAYPILAGHPLVFHHTPDIGLYQPADWCVLEYAARDRSTGYAGVFRLGTGPARGKDAEYLFKPRGLAPARRYRVTLDNFGGEFEADGFQLMTGGIRVRLDTPHTSELIMFREKKR